MSYTTLAQTDSEKEQITSRYDQQKILQLQSNFSAKAVLEKQRAVEMASLNNWPLIVEKDGAYMELMRVSIDGSPIYYTTFNVAAAKSTRADHLNNGGSLGLNLDGQNMTAHVWDGGLARSTHQEYDGPGGNNRFSIGDGTSTLNYHSAHVTGTIIASGVQANAKGMAPQAQAVGYDWNSDLAEASSAANSGMLVSNHSYGFRSDLVPDQYFGAYIADSRDWDDLLFNAPNYLMVVAAGNDGNSNYNGQPLDGNSAYDKLTGHSTSKNNLVVANALDANIDANGNLISVSINSSSSEGPTDDYRIKPDITGNGTSVYSTYESSDTAYNSITGTSMASPNVAGSCILLQQHANNVNGSFMKAATLKGIVLHTADDGGASGPDAIFGWGLMNSKRAAEAISNNGNESKIEELTLTSGQTYQITVDSDGVNDLMASISWTDRAGTATSATNSNTPVLVNDLDLRVSQGASTYTPWKLTSITSNGQGDNNVDPYERVDVIGASGTYTVTITHKGSLVGGSQNYSLIITGLSSTPVVCNATVPTNVNVDAFGDTTASISWDAVPGASYDLRYRVQGTSTWTTNSVSGSSTSLTGLSPETTYEVQVRSKCPDTSTSAYSSSVNFTTTEIQLNYCSSASTNINDEYIGRVQLNTIDNSSGGQFYTDFTNVSTT
ncbi:MAG: S8 family serine peptidase [Bacteroidia bacterium]|nr:S8 family serine peptidase [Bacteroidia bacterium]